MKPEDEMIDALLKEQARNRDADEELLASIETAIDEGGSTKAQTMPRWRRALPLSIAAGIAIGGAVIYQQRHEIAPQLAIHDDQEGASSLDPAAAEPLAAVELMEVAEAAAADRGDEALPAELIEGTPKPIRIPETTPNVRALPVPPAPDASSTPAPGTKAGANEARYEDASRATYEPGDRKVDADAVETVPHAVPTPADAAPQMTLRKENEVLLGRNLDRRASRSLNERHRIDDRLRRPIVPEDPGFGEGGAPGFSRDNYGQLVDQPWKSPWQEALSTFSIDVDNASYTNVRRMIREGRSIQPDAVRIEELINYFDYRYPAPEGESPFAVSSLLATCPWQPEHLLARVAIKGREIEKNARPASNLVFLIDVSGSMQSPDKLPMLKRAMQTLVNTLDERDRVGIVVYAGTEGVVLSPTELTEEGKSKALRQIGKLESGGSTNGGAGISRAYQMALKNMVDGGVNRVILATDGDFNVGTTGQGQLVDLVKGNAAKGVSLSVLGFGTGNLNDSMLEAITNDGNGNYFYVDGDGEAERIFTQKLTGTLVTIAKDVKIQIEFNPGKVKAYRLIGYANRVLRNQDFNNDKVDAGDIGAGHTVTAFYEIVPVGVKSPAITDVDELRYQRPADRRELVESNDWYTLKLRYKHPEGERSKLITTPVTGQPVKWKKADKDFRMASAVALFGMKLRGMEEVGEIGWDTVTTIARPALADDLDERRAEFLELVKELE